MFRPLPSFFQQYDMWLMCFYNSVSNGLVLLLQWLITERSHEDLDNSSATNIYHRYMTLQLPVAILKCLHWTNVCSKHPKWLERTQPDAGGSGRPRDPLHSLKWNYHFQSRGISPVVWRVWCQCQLNSVRSGWPLHQKSVIQAGCGAKNMLLAEGQSPAARSSCHAVSDALQMSPGGTMRSMLIHLKSHKQQKGKVKWEGQVDPDVIVLSCECSVT